MEEEECTMQMVMQHGRQPSVDLYQRDEITVKTLWEMFANKYKANGIHIKEGYQ